MLNETKFYVTLCLRGAVGSGLKAVDFKRKYQVLSTWMAGLDAHGSATEFEISESTARLFPAWFEDSCRSNAFEVDYSQFAPGEIVEATNGFLRVTSDLDPCKLIVILQNEYRNRNF